MDPKQIVHRSGLHRDIVSFFDQNPSSIDTPRGIATWVRGEYELVKEVLDELAQHGLLVEHKATSTTGYSYTRDPRLISQIKKCLEE